MDKFAFSVSVTPKIKGQVCRARDPEEGGEGREGERVGSGFVPVRFLGSHDPHRCPRISDTKCSSLRTFDDSMIRTGRGGEVGPRVRGKHLSNFYLGTRISNFPVYLERRNLDNSNFWRKNRNVWSSKRDVFFSI